MSNWLTSRIIDAVILSTVVAAGLQTASAQGPGLRGLEQEVIKPDVPVGEFRGRQMQSSDEWSLLLITDLDKNVCLTSLSLLLGMHY